jgi:hypothetical protein
VQPQWIASKVWTGEPSHFESPSRREAGRICTQGSMTCQALMVISPSTPRHSFRKLHKVKTGHCSNGNLSNDQKWIDRATVPEWEAEDPAKCTRRNNVQADGATSKILARETGKDMRMVREWPDALTDNRAWRGSR